MKFRTGAIGLIFATVVYTIVTLFSILLFGSDIQGDILKNFGESDHQFKYILLSIYLVLSSLHIPMVFFVGKEAILQIYAEFRYASISKENDRI